jgi:G:T-mismatch repair DNA endonuclease (very short patch repair protein)
LVKKGRKFSEEHKKKLSEAGKKRPKISEATRKKMSEVQKGRKFSEATRKKLSEARKKRPKISEATRKKMSEAQKGRKSSEATRKKISEAGKGRKFSEATRKKISEANTGKKHSEATRKKLSENAKNISKEHRKKMSEAHKNLSAESRKNMSKAWDSPEMKELARKHLREIRHNQVKPNKPELKIKKILIESKIEFSMFVNVKYGHLQHEADFLIKPNKIIEFNGTYSHADPRKYKPDHKIWNKIAKDVWERDKKIIDGMKQQGYKVLVVWESELKDELEDTTKKILKFVKT